MPLKTLPFSSPAVAPVSAPPPRAPWRPRARRSPCSTRARRMPRRSPPRSKRRRARRRRHRRGAGQGRPLPSRGRARRRARADELRRDRRIAAHRRQRTACLELLVSSSLACSDFCARSQQLVVVAVRTLLGTQNVIDAAPPSRWPGRAGAARWARRSRAVSPGRAYVPGRTGRWPGRRTAAWSALVA